MARWLLSAALAAGPACTERRPPPPVITAVDPEVAPGDVATPLRVLGQNFLARVTVDFDSPANSTLDTGFALWLASGQVRVPLENVRLVSDRELAAAFPAGAAAPGTYDLELRDPRGAWATLRGAFQVLLWDCFAQPDGTPCGSASCIAGGTCQASACACVNTAPLACFTVTPGAGTAGTTSFAFDASCSSDHEDPASALQVSFDFGDGTPPTALAVAKTATYTYAAAAPGSPPLVLTAYAQVMDTGGLAAFAEHRVVLFAAGDEVVVTTDADSGAGSLRDAIGTVNGLPLPAVITFADAYQIHLLSALPPLEASGAIIAGRPGVLIDCSATSTYCLSLAGAGQTLAGIAVSGSLGVSVELYGAGGQVAECSIVLAPSPTSVGIEVTGSGAVGPGNDVSGGDVGIRVASGTAIVQGNRVHGNRVGVVSANSNATIQRNLVFANISTGIQVTSTAGTVRFNTSDGNGADGLSPSGSVQVDVRDNLFTNNAAYGVGGPLGGAFPFDHNGYFGNGRGAIAGGALGPTDVTGNPRYLERAGADFHLLPGSPAIDAGVDVGLDVNGPAPGNFNGAAPDLGALETPY